MPAPLLTTPLPGFHFAVSFDLPNVTQAEVGFREVSGLTRELAVETVAEGGQNGFAHKLPGRASYPNLVLKRGMLPLSPLRDWCAAAIEELEIEPVSATVVVLDASHVPLQTYALEGVWPLKWEVSGFDANASGLLVESLEFAYRRFRILTPARAANPTPT